MFQSPISKLTLFFSALFSLLILFFIFLHSSQNSTTTIVFCDVGQGDGTYIRIKNRVDVLVDAGPGRKMLSCLGKYMPFYDRTIELAIISHPQKDHFEGFLYILDRYPISTFWMSQVYNPSRSFKNLLEKIETKHIKLEFPKAGKTAKISQATIDFFWPSDEFILKNSFIDSETPLHFRQTAKDINNFSLIFSLELSDIRVLFTGDATENILNRLLNESNLKSEILKIPHHGSKRGLSVEFLKLANPTYGVISVGTNNSYGHPSREVLDMLEARSVKIRRTDREGDIIFKIPNPNFQ